MTKRATRWVVICLLLALGVSGFAAASTPRQLMDNGHYNRARAILEPQLQKFPNDAEALCLMSQLKSLSGDNEVALQLAERAVKLDKKNPRYHLQLARVLVYLVDNVGGLRQFRLGRQLKSELQLTLALDPKNVDALKYQAAIYRNAPAIFGGDKDKARELADKIMQIDPVQGYFLQAELVPGDKRGGEAEEFYRKAVEANPSSYEARFQLARYCLWIKKPGDAETHARAALSLNPDRVEAYDTLAIAFAVQEKWGELDAVLAQAQTSIPDNLKPYYSAAVQIGRKGLELPRAERYLQHYLTQPPEILSPSHAQAHWMLGRVLEKAGRTADAVSEYQAAVKLEPRSPATRELQRLQAGTARPVYDPAQFDELVRSISAGADSLQRAQAITLQLARLRIPYDSRPFESGDKTGTNILAWLPAPDPGAPVIMIGAHLDRVAEGRGAVDNAAGVSAVLQLLATLKRFPLKKYQLVAAFWDQEEQGLAGSQAFVSSQARDRLPSVYINFDMLAYGDTLCAYWKNEKSSSAQAFRHAAGDQFPLRADFEFPPSDDRPFVAAGVEVVAVALADKREAELGLKVLRGESTQPPRILTIMHTPEDTPDKVSAADVTRALPVIERAIRLISEN